LQPAFQTRERAIETTGFSPKDEGDVGICDSCGAPTRTDDLEPVHRIWFQGVEDPVPEQLEAVERWCSGCRHTYPNAAIDPEKPQIPEDA